MEHEADVTGLPKVDTREACAFSVDSGGYVIHAGGSAGETFRRTPEDFERLSVRDLLDPESQSSRAAWAKLAKGEDFRGELRLRRGDGAVFLAEVSISKQPDDSFAVRVGGGGSLPDERVSSQAKRRIGGAGFLRSVDFHLVLDPHGNISRSSTEVGEHLGWDPEAMVGAPITDYIHPDDLAWTEPKLSEVRDTPASTGRIEARMLHTDGSWRSFEIAVSNLLDEPTVNGLVWHFKNVSGNVGVRDDLRRGGAQFRAIVEGSRDMITLRSEANTILYASPSYKRILGYEPEEMVGLHVPSVIHPDDLQTAAAEAARIPSEPEVTDASPIRHRCKDGSWVHLESVFTNLMDDPEIRAVVVHSRDVTGRVEAEEEVRRLNESLERIVEDRTSQLVGALDEAEDSEELMRLSESRFRSLVQRSSDITAVIDGDGAMVYVSPAVEATLGYRIGELMEERIPDHVHKDDRASLFEAFERVKSRPGETENAEFRFRHKDGSWRSLDAVLSNLSDEPGVAGIVVNARDVTERKEAEGRYRTLVEQLPLVTYVENAETNLIEYMSPQIEDLLGYPAEEYAAERSLRQKSILPEDVEWVRAEDERTDRTGEPYSVEHRRVTADGRLVWVRDEAVLIRDEEGRPMYWQGIVEDITERREAEDELKQSLNVLLALYETGQVLTSTLDLDTRGKRLLEIMAGLFGLRAAAIDLADRNSPDSSDSADGVLRPWKSKGDEDERLRSRQTAACLEARRDALASGKPRAFRQSEDTSLPPEGVCVPLRSRGRIVGFVEAFGGEGLGRKDNLDVFASLGNQSGSALENARLYSDLAERERRLEELVGKLITAQEEERRRVAYEIHDGLAQTALAASQMLQTFLEDHPPGASVEEGSLDRAMEMVRLTGREARRVIAGLRPTVLDDFGLAPALRLHVETLRRDGMSVEYRESLGEKRLPARVETALYRVAQEALNNARKHAPGSGARLTLHFSAEGSVRMEVADDGPGFDPPSVENDGAADGAADGGAGERGAGERVGLSSMRERVALLGGTFELESEVGRGASVKVEVNLKDGGGGG